MTRMVTWWQTIPQSIDPIAFSVGFFSVSWYALFYLFGALTVVWFLHRRLPVISTVLSREDFWSLTSSVFWGVLIGARLGYVFFYGETSVYLAEPWRIISPYDFDREIWVGIRGMSFFGGLAGGALMAMLFARRRHIPFLVLSDWIVPALPLSLFFGRLGNFLNGELIGRPTGSGLGMRFLQSDASLRYPSQLFEALGEGVLLFFFLMAFHRYKIGSGFLTAIFLIAYGSLRFSLEFFREPDRGSTQLFGWITLNQTFSLTLVILGIFLLLWFRRLWYNKSKLPTS